MAYLLVEAVYSGCFCPTMLIVNSNLVVDRSDLEPGRQFTLPRLVYTPYTSQPPTFSSAASFGPPIAH